MTRDQLKASFPNASESFLRANADPVAAGLQASQPERPAKRALERSAPGKAQGVDRFALRFAVFSRRPFDADNHWFKPLQDCLVEAGFLPDDDWRRLGQVTICTEKVYSEAEEGTLIKLETL